MSWCVLGYANELVLYYPLFITSYLCHDFLNHHDTFNANTLLISSSSSKTSIGLAFMSQKSKGGARNRRVVGLTSTKNAEFVGRVGVYDEVVAYDSLGSWMDGLVNAGDGSTFVYVDVAGSVPLRESLQKGLTSARLLKIVPLGMR
jgi:hypothetical protein